MPGTTASLAQGLAVIIGTGIFGGLANFLVGPSDPQPWLRLGRQMILGVVGAAIAFGVSGVAGAAIWQQISTCTIAGIGGGQAVRSYAKTRELQEAQQAKDTLADATKALVE